MWYACDSNVTFAGNQQHAQRMICTADNVDFCHGHHKKEKSANLLRHKKQAPFHLFALHWFYFRFFVCLVWGGFVLLFKGAKPNTYTEVADSNYFHRVKQSKMNNAQI